MDLIKKVKFQYYVSIIAAVFCLTVMLIAPFVVEGYLWQIMLMPLVIQLPLIINGRRVLRKCGAI